MANHHFLQLIAFPHLQLLIFNSFISHKQNILSIHLHNIFKYIKFKHILSFIIFFSKYIFYIVI